MDFDTLKQVGMAIIYYASPLVMLAGIAGFATSISLLMMRK
jgi:hypothetical protein